MAWEQECSLEAAGALVAAASVLGSFSTPLGVQVGPGLGMVITRTPWVLLSYSSYVVSG